jgi:hypothetical protein
VPDEFISVAAAAKILGRSPKMVRYYAECGALASRRIGPRGWMRVKHDDVIKLVGRLNDPEERGKPLYGS